MATVTTAVMAAGTLATATTAAMVAGTLATATTAAMAAGAMATVMTAAMAAGMIAGLDAVTDSPARPAIPIAMTAVARNLMAWTSSVRLVPAVRMMRANPFSGWRKTTKRTTTSNNRKSKIRRGSRWGSFFSRNLLTHDMGKDISN